VRVEREDVRATGVDKPAANQTRSLLDGRAIVLRRGSADGMKFTRHAVDG